MVYTIRASKFRILRRSQIMKKISVLFFGILFLSACGLQIIDRNSGGGSNTGLFSVGGTAKGIPHKKEIVVTINGVEYTIDQNGNFTLPGSYSDNANYNVVVQTNLPGAYVCTLQNGTGNIPNANVTNVQLVCECKVNSLGTGDGSENNPILIYTAEQMNQISLSIAEGDNSASTIKMDKHYKQVCDLDYTGIAPMTFGTDQSPLTGSYDGNGFFILHYTSLENDPRHGDLKGFIATVDHGVIKNVNLSDFYLEGFQSIDSSPQLGALTPTALHSVIENIYGEDIGINDKGHYYHGIGGLIGNQYGFTNANGPSYLSKVKVERVTLNVSASDKAGAIAGWTKTDSSEMEVLNSEIHCNTRCGGAVGAVLPSLYASYVSLSKVNAQDVVVVGTSEVGGVVGVSHSGHLQKVSSTGKVEGTTLLGLVGGVVGERITDKLSDSYTSTDIFAVLYSPGVGQVFGSNPTVVTNVSYDSTRTINVSALPQFWTFAQANPDLFRSGSDGSQTNWDFTDAGQWCTTGTFPHLRNVPFSSCE